MQDCPPFAVLSVSVAVTVYPLMTDPLVLAGGVHVMVAVRRLLVALTVEGAVGKSYTSTVFDAGLGRESPLFAWATTLNL